jgi:glyoxylase-like metal-dependent hydrolase (beta-lactamase superfamily II)
MPDPIQMFEPASCTYTYLLIDEADRDAVLIDPVDEDAEKYLERIAAGGLRLLYIFETHVHADHVTAAAKLKDATGAKTAAPAGCGVPGADLAIFHGEVLTFGGARIEVIHTPGHTPGSVSYLWRDCVFTGDALLIGGCGRTDFQGGDAGVLYDSITGRLFTLPDTTHVFPGHDYRGHTVSSIGEEKKGNPRLAGKTRTEFIEIMRNLRLDPPKMIDVAVPANKRGGVRHDA